MPTFDYTWDDEGEDGGSRPRKWEVLYSHTMMSHHYDMGVDIVSVREDGAAVPMKDWMGHEQTIAEAILEADEQDESSRAPRI